MIGVCFAWMHFKAANKIIKGAKYNFPFKHIAPENMKNTKCIQVCVCTCLCCFCCSSVVPLLLLLLYLSVGLFYAVLLFGVFRVVDVVLF